MEDRRGFLSRALMASGLGSVVAALGAMAVRYVSPLPARRRTRRLFLAPASDLPEGRGRFFGLPGGESALVIDTGAEVVALSEVCPHLGCKVHYNAAEGNFVCPCHQGIFEKDGRAISGPPADEGKNLKRYPVRRVGQNLFIDVEESVEL